MLLKKLVNSSQHGFKRSKGKIQSQVTIEDGFENAPHAFKNLFTGDNFGKQVIKVTE